MPTALIIGASRGIGQELALQYKAAGWRVIATARSADHLAALQADGCEALPLDVNNLNDCAGLGWRLDDEKIDVAIVNAGVYGPHTNGLTSPQQEQFDEVMHTNVLADAYFAYRSSVSRKCQRKAGCDFVTDGRDC